MPKSLPTLLHFAAATAVFVLCFATPQALPQWRPVAKIAAWVLVGGGMALAGWAVFHLKDHVLGFEEPRRERLLTSGPYRHVRHPIYLGFAVAMLGVVVATRSPAGLAGYLLLFIPSEIHRARCEEEALDRKFGGAWRDYARRTGFFFPTGRRGSG